jgi:hypothetical protein
MSGFKDGGEVIVPGLLQFAGEQISEPRVGSSEVVVVRYCSELQFSSSQ